MNTQYHELYNKTKNYFDGDYNKVNLLEDIKQLYINYQNLYKNYNQINGAYGIEYKYYKEDSSYTYIDYIWLDTEENRDKVCIAWDKKLYWDDTFNMELLYPCPQTLLSYIKVFRDNGKIYKHL